MDPLVLKGIMYVLLLLANKKRLGLNVRCGTNEGDFAIALCSMQSTLGFETLDKAAALGLATTTPLTDPRQYINSNLGFSNLKI